MKSYENGGDLAQPVGAHSFLRCRWGYMLRMARTYIARDLTRRGRISANYWLYIAHAETDSFHSIKSQRSTYHLLSISCKLILPDRPCLSPKGLSRERHLSLSSGPAASNTVQYSTVQVPHAPEKPLHRFPSLPAINQATNAAAAR